MFYRAEEIIIPAGVITFGAVNFFCLFWYSRFLAGGKGRPALLWLAALVISIALFWYQAARLPHTIPELRGADGIDAIAALAGAACLVYFAVPFIAKLHLKWIGGLVTEEEKTRGPIGVRAWLSAQNLICAFLLSLCASIGYGYSFWAIFPLTLFALLAYPIVHYSPQSVRPSELSKDELSGERDRILKLLEDGKINGGESAALLNALGGKTKSNLLPSASNRKLVLTGAGLVLVGFFLPWFSINPGQEAERQLQNLTGNPLFERVAPQQAPNAELQTSFHLKTETMSVNGGDIQKGLGWLILVLGMAAAVAPYTSDAMHSNTQRVVLLAALGLGTIALLYLLTQSFRFCSIGIVLVLAGYALEFLGAIKDRQGGS